MAIKVYSNERGLRTLKEGVSFEQYQAKYPSAMKIKSVPSMKTLEKWSMDGIAKTPCGCKVEPDGQCQHGRPSWLIVVGIV
jgi:hypothetical protein